MPFCFRDPQPRGLLFCCGAAVFDGGHKGKVANRTLFCTYVVSYKFLVLVKHTQPSHKQ